MLPLLFWLRSDGPLGYVPKLPRDVATARSFWLRLARPAVRYRTETARSWGSMSLTPCPTLRCKVNVCERRHMSGARRSSYLSGGNGSALVEDCAASELGAGDGKEPAPFVNHAAAPRPTMTATKTRITRVV